MLIQVITGFYRITVTRVGPRWMPDMVPITV